MRRKKGKKQISAPSSILPSIPPLDCLCLERPVSSWAISEETWYLDQHQEAGIEKKNKKKKQENSLLLPNPAAEVTEAATAVEEENFLLLPETEVTEVDAVKKRKKKRRGKQQQQPRKEEQPQKEVLPTLTAEVFTATEPKYYKLGLWFENEEVARRQLKGVRLPWPEDYERMKLEAEQRRKRRNLKYKQQQNKEQPFRFQQEGDFPDIVFVLHSTDVISYGSDQEVSYVYALDTTTTTTTTTSSHDDDDLDPLPLKLLFQFPRIMGMDFVSVKSTLYGIGGYFDNEAGKFPTDFLICDLSDWRNRDKFKWEDGPALKGPKPSPVLAMINGLIYALAGYNDKLHGSIIPEESAFEVFEPGLGWKFLPPPPFCACYSNPGGPSVLFSTVVETTIYVGLERSLLGLYSYDVVAGVWKHISLEVVDPCDMMPRNLFKCYWTPSAEVANNMVFQCTSGCSTLDGFCKSDVAPQVYAWDLAAKEEEVENTPAQEEVALLVPDGDFDGGEDGLPTMTDEAVLSFDRGEDGEDGAVLSFDGGEDGLSTMTDEAVSTADSDFLSWDEFPPTSDGEVVSSDSDDGGNCYPGLCFPVRGLKAVTGFVKGDITNTEGFVAHLAKDVYCLVYFYRSPRWMDFRICVCTFQVVEKQARFLRATILQSALHPIFNELGLEYTGNRCKICM